MSRWRCSSLFCFCKDQSRFFQEKGIYFLLSKVVNSDAVQPEGVGALSEPYQVLNDYVYKVQQEIGATAAAVYLIQKDVVVNEWYSGRQGADITFRAVDAQTRFSVCCEIMNS